MSETDRSAVTSESWRCRQCGTPNPSRPYLTNCLGCGTIRGKEATVAQGGPGSTRQPGPVEGPRVEAPRAAVRAWVGRASASATWIWAIVVMIVLLLIRWVGDRWWGVTVLLFLPRWLFLAPLPVLALASGLAGRPRHWILQAVVALVVAGPLMLISLPVHQLWARPLAGTRVRIMTFNQGPGRLDQERLIRIIEQERIDVICFQEGRPDRNPRLAAYLDGKGWYRDRKKRYLASRYPIVSEMTPPHENMLVDVPQPVLLFRARVRLASGVEFGVASVHMPTLRFGFYRFLDRDVEGLKQHILWHEREMARLMGGLSEMNDGPFLVGGDFNIPSDHAMMAAVGSSLRFAHEDAGWGYGYTRPSRYPWFRIDHILASPEWVFTRCWAGPDLGSDHLPLIAEAVLPASGGPAVAAIRGLPRIEE